MGRNWILFFVIVGVVVLTSILGYPWAVKIYETWGRRLIYSSGSKVTEYPGSGHITQPFYDQIFVNPKFEGRPFFDPPENRSQYSTLDYEIIDVPAQEQLLYAVGMFEGWEDIPNSLDKYLIVKYPNSDITEKWRLSFEKSDLFKEEATKIAIENVRINLVNHKKNIIELPLEPDLFNVSFDSINTLIKRDDSIILVPVFSPPYLSKKDFDQNLLSSWIILRRVDGKEKLIQ